MADLDCLVIGAGFAGLRAATELRRQGLTVRVLEARDRVGGRAAPGELAGHRIDLGGMWLSPAQRRLTELAARVGVRTYPQPLEGRCSVRFAGRTVTAPRDAFDQALGLIDRIQLLLLVRRFEREAAALPADEPWGGPRSARLDAESVAAWCRRATGNAKVRELMDLVCRALLCAEASEVSMLFMLHYARSGRGLESLLGMSDEGAQAQLVEGGAHQLGVALAEGLGDDLVLEAAARAVEHTEEQVTLHTDGASHRARRLVVTSPAPQTARVEFSPALPAAKRSLLARSPMGACIKAWLAYETPFWRAQGLNAFLLSDEHPFSPIFDATPPGADVGLLAGFFEAKEALRVGDWPTQARREAATEAVAFHLGVRARSAIGYVEKDWTQDPWTDGCYGAYLAPGVLTTRGPTLRAPVGRIHWAGTETATEWTGYIEGALESADRAVAEILAAERS